MRLGPYLIPIRMTLEGGKRLSTLISSMGVTVEESSRPIPGCEVVSPMRCDASETAASETEKAPANLSERADFRRAWEGQLDLA